MTVPGLRGTTGATSIPGNAVKAAREAKRNQFQDARMKALTAEPLKDSCAKPTLTSARKHAESARKLERIQNARMNESTHCRTSKRFMCKTYPDKCEKTCGKCKETRKNSKCKDERDNCRTYKKFMCKNYPDKCKKTCGKCKRKEEKPVSR